MFIQWEFLGLQIQETASQVALRELLWGGKGGARLHRSSATKGSSLNIKRLLWIKGKPTCQCRRCKRLKFDPWVGKILWRRKWQPTPVFFPEKSHGQRNLTGYSPWGCKELDATEQTHTHTHTHTKQQNTRYLKLRNLVLSYVWEKSRVSVGEGNGNPLQYSCLENPMDRGAWWAIVHGVTKRWTRLTK